jgi:hypothetical protein
MIPVRFGEAYFFQGMNSFKANSTAEKLKATQIPYIKFDVSSQSQPIQGFLLGPDAIMANALSKSDSQAFISELSASPRALHVNLNA